MKPSVSRHHLLTAASSLIVITAAHAVVTTQTYDDTSLLNSWNLTDSNWDASAATWTNDNDAIFGGSGEAVTVTAVSAHNLAINSSGYSFTGGTLTLTGTTPTITANADVTISSVIAGSAGLAKSGASALTLSGTNSYTGTTAINGGVIRAGSLLANGTNSNIGAGTDVSLDNGTLRYTGGNSGSNAGPNFNRNISVGAGGGTLDNAGSGFLFYSGTITGSGPLKVIDSSGDASNRQILLTSNNPSFSGAIEVGNGSPNSGYLQQRSNAASPFGTASIKISTGGVLASDGGATAPSALANSIELSGGTLATQAAAMNYTGPVTSNGGTIQSFVGGQAANLTITGNLTANAATTLNASGGAIVINGNISGAGALTVDGTGGGDQWTRRVILNGNSGSASGAINVINSGKLWSTINATNNPIGDTADVSIATAGIFSLYGQAGKKETIGGLNGTGTVDFGDGGAGKSLTLEVGGGDKNGSFGGALKNTGTSGGPTVLSLRKIGTGTQILSGTNLNTGTTTVAGGTLQVDGALGTGAVTVDSTGHLKGTGALGGSLTALAGGAIEAGVTVGGSLTVSSGATVAPGGVGTLATLNVTGATTLSGTAAFEVQKAAATLNCDVLNASGILTYGGNLTVTSSGDALALGDSFQLFTTATSYTGSFAAFTLPTLPAGLSWDTSTLATDGRITVVNYVGTPSFNPASGGYVGAQSVTITSDSGSTIRYTTDGSNPITSGTAISGPSPLSGVNIPVNASVTLKAYATKAGQAPSPVAEATYATASSAVWNVDDNGVWSDSAKWLNGIIPNASNAPVDFHTLAQSGPATVTLDSNRTVGSMTFGNTNAFDWTIDSSGDSVLTMAGSAPTITVIDNAATVSAPLAGTQGLVKAGAGVLNLNAANSYSGATTVSEGILATNQLGADGSSSGIGTGSGLSLNGTTFRYTGGNNGSDAGAKFNRAISIGATGGTIDIGGGGFLFYAGSLTGSGKLTVVDGNGDASNRQLLVTSDNPSFTGNLEIGNGNANSGWVQYRSSATAPFGTGTITLLTGGILSTDLGSTMPATLANNIVLNGGTLGAQSAGTSYNGDITATTGTTSFLRTNLSGSANLVIGGKLVGNGTVEKNGGGNSVEMRGDNSGYSGAYNHTADGATIFYTANSASAAASWNIPTGSNAAARFMAAAANGTYKLGALSGTTGRVENLNAASGNSVFEIGALGTDTTFAGVIRNGGGGTVAISKVGGGKLTLTGANIYTGSTVVTGGTLELASPGSLAFAPAANHVVNGITGSGALILDGAISISLATADTTDGNSWQIVDNASLTESYGDNFTVTGFTEASPGVWTKDDGLRTWTFTEATGALTLPGEAGYGSWETANGIAGAGSTADSDGDGIANGIEFVIGGDPSGPGSDSNALLPTVTTDATYLKFVFRRTDASAPNNPAVEYGTTLASGSWTAAQAGVNGVTVAEENDFFGAGTDRVTVSIPRTLAAPGTKLFARLRVDIP